MYNLQICHAYGVIRKQKKPAGAATPAGVRTNTKFLTN